MSQEHYEDDAQWAELGDDATPTEDQPHVTDGEQWQELGEEEYPKLTPEQEPAEPGDYPEDGPAESEPQLPTEADDVFEEGDAHHNADLEALEAHETEAEKPHAVNETEEAAYRDYEEEVPHHAHEEETPQQVFEEEATHEVLREEAAYQDYEEEAPHHAHGEGAPHHAHEEEAPQQVFEEEATHEVLREEAAYRDYEEEAPHHAQALPMPATQPKGARTRTIVKPRTRKVKRVARWEPVEHNTREGSDDEFELSTCMTPVYEGEGEGEEGTETTSAFKNGEPDCRGEVMSCFEEPNLLYRIINPEDKTWAFYNDSLNYEMHVQFTFGKHSKLEPLENTTMDRNDEGQFVTEVVVYPTETEMFVQGTVNGFTSKLRAVPLTDDYHSARRGITEEQVEREMAAIRQVSDSDTAEDVLQACIENGIPFVDPEFPPCQASLDGGSSRPFKPLAWARPQTCLPEDMASQVRLFRTTVQPGCVDAGDLGDSWVMCSVAAVSESPARLIGMFRHPEGKSAAQREHAVGAYRVTFNKNGWWRSVLVDSYLPVSGGKLKYAKSATDPAEIWPAILEKAYAKLHGSYSKICSGDPLHALQDMIGFSSMRFDDGITEGKTKNQVFDELTRAIASGYTVILSTPGRGSHDKDQELADAYGRVGLVAGHAYTILESRYIEDKDLRLVKIRNAWGRGLEWNGDWSADDKKWDANPDIADECNFQRAADGTFWMSWVDAQKYFNGGGVCFSHEPAYDYRMNCVFAENAPSVVLEIEVQSPTWFTFVISQDDKRCQVKAKEYRPVMISVAKPTAEGMYKVVMNSSANGARPSSDRWTFLQARDIALIHKLEAGRYIIVPRVMPSEDQADPLPFVLGMICNKEIGSGDVSVRFKRLDASNRVFENFPKFEPELLEVEQPVQFQKRAPGEGFPLTQMGEELA